MKNIEKLYEVLGELLYAVAKADGVIQAEEKNAMETFFRSHSFGEDVKWSFNYEVSKDLSMLDIYNKVINFCHSYGPAPEYVEFIEAMKVIAKAAEGISEQESKIINSFSKDLLARFQADMDKLNNFEKDMSAEE